MHPLNLKIYVSGKFLVVELPQLPSGFSVSYCIGLRNATGTRLRDFCSCKYPFS